MRRISAQKGMILLLGGLFVSLSVMQCTKAGDNAGALDRAYTGTPDSTTLSVFYDSYKISTADATADVNDVIEGTGVQSIVKTYCVGANCHGGKFGPNLSTYSEIMALVTPGSPETSKLWNLITTNDLNKAMPPINIMHELSLTEKGIIYNWIKNGAKEQPGLNDFRPVAMKLLVSGCGSANCHNQATATGAWARKALVPGLVSADTTQFLYTNPLTGLVTVYCQLSNQSRLNQVWGSYKDSVRRFYADTLANASFRPYKTFGTPVTLSSVRGPLSDYDDILLDIMYPKSVRSNSTVQFTDGSGNKFYVKGNPLNATSSLISRIDSTLLLANPYTGIYATNHQGDMAYGDGGLKRTEIALIKAWYFADPNVPDVWKYGVNNVGIFKYRKTGKIIMK
ncbi:MAG: hypothetical protein IPP79_06615 [Chitinophagaceae bacterium]|nr:hypothetical protein [Chitinophagaceae bacterium]